MRNKRSFLYALPLLHFNIELRGGGGQINSRHGSYLDERFFRTYRSSDHSFFAFRCPLQLLYLYLLYDSVLEWRHADASVMAWRAGRDRDTPRGGDEKRGTLDKRVVGPLYSPCLNHVSALRSQRDLTLVFPMFLACMQGATLMLGAAFTQEWAAPTVAKACLHGGLTADEVLPDVGEALTTTCTISTTTACTISALQFSSRNVRSSMHSSALLWCLLGTSFFRPPWRARPLLPLSCASAGPSLDVLRRRRRRAFLPARARRAVAYSAQEARAHY